MKRIIGIILIASMLAITVVGCSGDSGTATTKEVNFADAGWDSNKLHNAIAGLVAEELWDYEIKETPGSSTVLHEGLLKGEVDVHMEVWTDNLATYSEDLAAGKLQELGTNFDDNNQGVYVPRYVIEGDAERGIVASAPDLKSIQDLKNYPDVFKDEENAGMGRMYGAIPGWQVDEILYKKFMYLGMEENFIYFRPGSDAALSTAITSAYEKGEPIAAYYWEPTWLLGLYDMVLLEDEPFDQETYLEGKTAMPSVDVTVGVSNEFGDAEENKEFIDFLSNYETSSALTSEGLGYMQESGSDYKETAKWFLNEHPELLDAWLTPEDAEAMKTALNQ
ncbi:MAG: ABC transporter substrate-binding protein [Gudongella sp.]|nr:ABC transporter substrate-binding protein [Gudongella sp.]